jgi:hypothetical protein
MYTVLMRSVHMAEEDESGTVVAGGAGAMSAPHKDL